MSDKMHSWSDWLDHEGFYENLSSTAKESARALQETRKALDAALEGVAVFLVEPEDDGRLGALVALTTAVNNKSAAEAKWAIAFASEASERLLQRVALLEARVASLEP